MDEYVFGDAKDEETNLIPKRSDARRIYELLTQSGEKFDVIYCHDLDVSDRRNLQALNLRSLGFDVVAVRADYWSIVADFPESEWAKPFKDVLNKHGLFADRSTAETFLEQYRKHGELDCDSPFDVLHIMEVPI